MDHLERFYRTIERRDVDRPAAWLGMPVPEAVPGLLHFFKVRSLDELKAKLDDDLYPLDMPYSSPDSNHIATALKFAKKTAWDHTERTLTAPGFFEDYEDPDRIDDFPWPDPAQYIDPEACLRAVEEAPPGYARLGVLWSCHFQDACSAFGMETALVKMLTEPDMFQAVIDRITAFYLKANEIFYRATAGKLHAVLIGNDMGSQTGLMLSPESIRTYVMPGIRKLVDQAKQYGLKVIYHSCGAVDAIIGDLIGAGVDAVHPIQALAAGMDPHHLKKQYGSRISFCGGVDAQNLLVFGKPADVSDKVRELKALFPTGLIISPSHEAILPDVDPANIAALFAAVREN